MHCGRLKVVASIAIASAWLGFVHSGATDENVRFRWKAASKAAGP
jgi:hypothetical protein